MYFDYAATTPVRPEVLATFTAATQEFWANPHALHHQGMRAEALLEQARAQVLTLLSATSSYQCLFTSGATESNNTVIKGIPRLYHNRGKHLITSAIEHPSVRKPLEYLVEEGYELTILPVTVEGMVDPKVLRDALRPDTVLVSLMHVNNEIGSIFDYAALGTVIKEHSSAFFHVDAAQSVGKLPLSLHQSPIDFLTFSAHKFGGLKGSGALLVPKNIRPFPLLHGGGQEFEYRSGTADVPRAAALAKALRLACEEQNEVFSRVQAYRQEVIRACTALEGVHLNGSSDGSPFIVNFSVEGIRPETILHAFAEQDMFISTVSACSASKHEESTTVKAVTGSSERALSTIRLSFSSLTTHEEISAFIASFPSTIQALRFQRK